MTSSTNPNETINEEAVGAAARVLADRAGGWSPPGWWHERTARESLAAAFPALRAQIETEDRATIARVDAVVAKALREYPDDLTALAVARALGKGGRS